MDDLSERWRGSQFKIDESANEGFRDRSRTPRLKIPVSPCAVPFLTLIDKCDWTRGTWNTSKSDNSMIARRTDSALESHRAE